MRLPGKYKADKQTEQHSLGQEFFPKQTTRGRPPRQSHYMKHFLYLLYPVYLSQPQQM
jgi:hypothetical protein